MESYLQMAIGDSTKSVALQDVQKAIVAIQQMDDEHGAFWVGLCEEDEIVLETHKDLTVIGIFPDQEIRAQLPTWAEVENLYRLFLQMDFEQVKGILQKLR